MGSLLRHFSPSVNGWAVAGCLCRSVIDRTASAGDIQEKSYEVGNKAMIPPVADHLTAQTGEERSRSSTSSLDRIYSIWRSATLRSL